MSETTKQTATPRVDAVIKAASERHENAWGMIKEASVNLAALARKLERENAELLEAGLEMAAKICEDYALEDVTEEAASGMECCADRIRAAIAQGGK